ncbi:helix-turn-helix domain-containing protein [Phreatobacter sp. AB_2022a]|uniref:helix-turn-helix domain-containing protein n=1 Tax=Phreatobacter sp. AB_2022a TaxID=3003134 RepID=UPI002287104E|nr:helix-turn-helix domain-containing protein [Phreatobacter sp. AB_2022a]MCZ0735834.1 helix-turn-helix domain-containing protein [Phreatobacter sp. AB_2022a]
MSNNLRYDYAGDDALLEGADWHGRRPGGLDLHYHEEVQVSVIWNGARDYLIGRRAVTLRPGEILVVPAGRPHHAQPTLGEHIRSVEFYLAPAALPAALRLHLAASDYLFADAPELREMRPADVAARLVAFLAKPSWHRQPAQPAAAGRLIGAVAGHRRISEAAETAGLSREGFIRAFSREIGMTPHAWRINDRLNLGRRLLRAGEPVSDVAYAAGFSDQSHFGRSFLKLFGATPGQFRAAHGGF